MKQPLSNKPCSKSRRGATIVEGVMAPDHKQAAKAWIDFLRSDEAQDILENVGFERATEAELAAPFIYEDSESNSRVGEY